MATHTDTVVDPDKAMTIHECSGLRVCTEIPLASPPLGPGPCDVEVRLGEATDPPHERPSADVVAELTVDGYPWYTFCRVDDHYVGRCFGIADFEIADSLDRIICRPAVGGNPEFLPIVVAGTVLAFVLAAAGRYVLHGSAVDIDGEALAFVGASGQGKSTMATIMCAAGGRLITDDVLPLEFDETGSDGDLTVLCRRSAHELRLRPKAVSLLDRFDDRIGSRLTADERHAVAPEASHHDRLPLRAVVLPRPDPTRSTVSARRLGAGEAAIWLGRCQRIEGWRHPDVVRQQFNDGALVVAHVPVLEVFVPWGPPFADDLAHQVLQVCGIRDPVVAAGAP
jgi:hypothetical protein